jgi:thiamine biosynthesis lipoprotein
MAAAMPPPGQRTGRALGTFATLLTTEAAALDRAHAFLTAELLAVDAACSRFRQDAELWRVNHAKGRPVRVSPLLAEALTVALDAARLTGGDVDPTCGTSLVRLGYDRDFTRARRHTSALRQPAAPAPGWRSVEFDPVLGEVRVPAGVVLDLGATAKALAADRAAVTIEAELGCGVLVNLGGDIRVAGPPPEGGWRVGIADDVGFDGGPAAGDGAGRAAPAAGTGAGQVVMLHSGGLATSGTAVRSWRRGSARLHHIIVPATGLPAASCWRAVSVAAATCVAANTASTAAILRGERATEWLAGLGLPARLVRHAGTAVTVAGWPENAPPDDSLAAGRSAGTSAADRSAEPLAAPGTPGGHRSHGH